MEFFQNKLENYIEEKRTCMLRYNRKHCTPIVAHLKNKKWQPGDGMIRKGNRFTLLFLQAYLVLNQKNKKVETFLRANDQFKVYI